MAGTKEDARLIVDLARLYIESESNKAAALFWSEDFPRNPEEFRQRYPLSSDEARQVFAALGFFETVATLWKHELIDGELLLDWLSVGGAWGRLREIALDMREQAGEPRLWENFEALAQAQAPAGAPA
jgi:hypothetical protein